MRFRTYCDIIINMENYSLYRRYRPDSFDGVIGQDHIVRTLKNQVIRGKVGHAYLFTGTRGTGKTTTAKIFARAVNCLSPVDGSPCGECEVCKELKKRSNLDIIEIDAASNNGVDDIRELKEKAQFRPAIGKKKVYIVDEVHMLSTSAFNALLKTLEEPPEHVIFILATTEVQKIPATILSRCLRFDFRLIPQELIARQIACIFDEQGVKYEEEAVHLIAASGNGSDRDALSTADMCLSYSDGKTVTYGNVLEVLGASDPSMLLDVFEAMTEGDTGEALEAVSDIVGLGKNIGVLASDLAVMFRNAVFIKTSRRANDLLKLPQAQFERLSAATGKTSLKNLVHGLDAFTAISGELKLTTQPRILFEATVVNATEKMRETASAVAKTVEPGGNGQKKNLTENADDSAEFCEVTYDNPGALWAAATERINAEQNTFLRFAMEKAEVAFVGDCLSVTVEEGSQLLRPQNKIAIGRALKDVGCALALEIKTISRKDDTAVMSKLIEDFEGKLKIKN